MSDLPPGWEWTTIGAVAATSLGKMLDKKQATGLHPTPYLRNINVRWESFDLSDLAEMDIRPEELDRVLARPGDVIACEGGEPGRAAVWRGPGTIALQKALHLIRPTEAILPGYLAHLLQHLAVSRRLEPFFTGTTIKHLPQEKLRLVPVPLPPRAEQEQIVAAIEEHLSRLVAAEANLQRVDAAAGVLLATTRATIDRADWPRRQLQEVAEVQLGKMLSAKSRTGVGSTPYLRNRNVRWGRVDVSEVAVMDFTVAEREKFRLVAGDVLICEGGAGVGRTAVWRDELEYCCYQKALHRVRVGDALLPEFLAAFIRHFVESRQLEKHLSGVAIGHFPQEDLRRLRVPVPDVVVQRDWLEWFDAQAGLVDHAHAATVASKARSARLRSSILAAAFTGQLVAQDPDDEPASLLLERVRAERATAKPAKRSRKAKVS